MVFIKHGGRIGMTKEDYYRIRDSVYKNAGMDKFDFDLMMCRVVMKAVEEEREACAKLVEEWGDPMGASLQIRARG
jgi:hypothetical protein